MGEDLQKLCSDSADKSYPKASKVSKLGNNNGLSSLISRIAIIFYAIAVSSSKRIMSSSLQKYILQSNYTLSMNLLDYFYGNNLSFRSSSQNGSEVTILTQVIQSVNQTVNFLDETCKIIGFESFNGSALLLVDGIMTDKNNYYLFYFFSSQPVDGSPVVLSSLNKTIPKDSTIPVNKGLVRDAQAKQTVFGMEKVTVTGDFYIDLQLRSTSTSDQLDFLLIGNIKTFSNDLVSVNRSTTSPSTNVVPTHRTITIPTVSMVTGIIFRQSIYNDKNQSTYFEFLRLNDVQNNSVNFKTIFSLNNSVENIKNIMVYWHDIFIFCETKIFRLQLNVNTIEVEKKKEIVVESLTSGDLSITEGHTDIFYTSLSGSTPSKEVKKVRWDKFDYPFNMDSIMYSSPVKSISISNQMITLFSKSEIAGNDAVVIMRSTDQYVYTSIDCQTSRCCNYTLTTDGITIAMVDASMMKINLLRNSAYLTVKKPKNDLVTVESYSNNRQVGSISFTIKLWDDSTVKVFNTETINTETLFMDETVASEFLFNKLVPSSWFMGNFIKTNISCKDMPQNATGFYAHRYLGNKKLSLDLGSMSSRNIFYFEIFSKDIEGTYILVFQLELKIYIQKCTLSQTSQLRCRTIKMIGNETDMIIEGSIIQGKYFAYLTNRGYFVQKIKDQKIEEQVVFKSQGTCKQLMYLNYDMLACSNFETKALDIKIIRPDGVVTPLFSKPNCYSTKIDYLNNSQFIFLLSEYTIEIISIRTATQVANISSNITKKTDKTFKICGKYLVVISAMMNAFETYDVSDVFNIVSLQGPTSLTPLGLTILTAVKVKFEEDCALNWPLVVTDGTSVYAVFINLGGPSVDLLDNKIYIGPSNYMANYFLNAMNLLSSSTKPRVIWSILDTSNNAQNTFLGFEVEIYRDYMLEMDLSAHGNLTSNISCKLEVSADDPNSDKFVIPFELKSNTITSKVEVANSPGVTIANQTFDLQIFDSISILNSSEKFVGQPLAYVFNGKDEDFNKSIIYRDRINRDEQFSKLIKCSREDTMIRDFLVSKRNSFMILTTEAIYKIKNATDYYVQNYMMFTNTASAGEKTTCQKMLMNEDSNIMVSLCDQSNVPMFLISNWNSLKPGIVFQKQVQDFKDISNIRDSFNDGNSVFLFSKSIIRNLQLTTVYHKYMVKLDMSKGTNEIDITLVKEDRFNHEFIFISQFVNTSAVSNSNTNSKTSKSASGMTDGANYFVVLSGTNKFVEDTYILVYKDYKSNNNLNLLANVTLQSILGSSFSGFFSSIKNLKCKWIDNAKTTACAVIQERNIHYTFKISVDIKEMGSTASMKLWNVFMNYANQVPSGAMEFSDDFFVMVSSRPSSYNSSSNFLTNLTKNYLLTYIINPNEVSNSDPKAFNNLIQVATGLPLPTVNHNTTDVKLQIVEIGGLNYLFMVSKSYYPFQTYRLDKNSYLEINKNVQSDSVELIAVNHYSQATINFKIVDKFLKIIVYVGVVMAALILSIFLYTFFCSKKRRGKTTHIPNINGLPVANIGIDDEDDEDMVDETLNNIRSAKQRFSLLSNVHGIAESADARNGHITEIGESQGSEIRPKTEAKEGDLHKQKDIHLLSSDEDEELPAMFARESAPAYRQRPEFKDPEQQERERAKTENQEKVDREIQQELDIKESLD